MLRIVLALAVLAPLPTMAAEIWFEDALACDKLTTHQSVDRMVRAGDKEGVEGLLNLAVSTGFCGELKKGTKVRIVEEGDGYVCVRADAAASTCRWVKKRLVWR